MADFLGSLLNTMQKPPVLVDAEKKKAREQKEKIEQQQQQEKDKLSAFRVQIQKRINIFVKDGAQQRCKFETMDKVYRAIVHEVADVAGLSSFSFGIEEADRYVMLWKKEFAPCDDELLALRRGEVWDPEKARLLAAAQEAEARIVVEQKPMRPIADYHQKYEHLLGKETAKDAARATSANRSYGFVPSENKRDHRTIEQVLAESQARKRMKTETSVTGSRTVDTSTDSTTKSAAHETPNS